MKRILFLTVLFICALQFSSVAQTDKKAVTPPSDASTGYTYDFDKTNDLIIERLSHPTSANDDVQALVEEPGFPKLNKGEKITLDYKKKVASWVESHPALVIAVLKNRKDIVHPF
ncbi:MAG: hypothetical protein H0W73_06715 [Bacteroidetes bacterium]|nr:hypothetical protein [Bacteroidota bacterium]